MAEEILTEIHGEMPNDMNHLASDPRQKHVEDEATRNITKWIENCGDGDLKEDCCIYRVPIVLRGVKEEAYTPTVVSIGPFHHGNERLKDMESHKKIVFKRFIERATSSVDKLVTTSYVDKLVCFVRPFEPKIRASYSETIELNEQQLVELTLVDAGFIIELFIMMLVTEDWNMIKDAKLSHLWLMSSILRDLILLENQLPFFVIEEIFNKAFLHDHCSSLPSFLTLACESFEWITHRSSEPDPDIKIKHFTDLLRHFHLQGRMPPRLPLIGNPFSYNAKALQEAGIKLKASDNVCLLDLNFSGHNLEIPQVLLEDRTEILFRNMIALEQCYYPYASYISDYAIVLDCLIDTYKDVDLLVHEEIVKCTFGDSNQVAELLNSLSNHVVVMDFNSEYLNIGKMLNNYCQDSRRKMMATLRRDYFNTPWHTVASIAGIILLVAAIVQTIFSVLQVVLNK